MKKQTANVGAAETRNKIVRKIRRLLKNEPDALIQRALGDLLLWVQDMDIRSQAKPGGLGRKLRKK